MSPAGGRVTVETVARRSSRRSTATTSMRSWVTAPEDVVWAMARGPHPWGRKYEGAEAVREALAARFRSIPDARWEDGGNWVAGDVGVSEWTLRGTTAKGEKLELLGCDLWRFRDGKVVRKDTYWKQIDEEFT